jgi:hypothetical protein
VAPSAGPSPVSIWRCSALMRLLRMLGRKRSEGKRPQTTPPMWLACETRGEELPLATALTMKKTTNSTITRTRRNGHEMLSKLTTRSATNSPMKPNTAPLAPTSSVQAGSNAALTRLAPTPAAHLLTHLLPHTLHSRGWRTCCAHAHSHADSHTALYRPAAWSGHRRNREASGMQGCT